MPRLKAVAIELSQTEREQLQQLEKRHRTPQQLAKRARIILMAEEGQSNHEIARQLNVTRDTVRLWRQRWACDEGSNLSPEERLSDLERPGAPAKFNLEQVTQLYALACDPPEKYGRPISHWSAKDLAEEMVEQEIVDSISQRHVGRLLEEAELKPHQTRYWLHPPRTHSLKPKSKISAMSTL